MKIGFDVDGVLAHFDVRYRRLVVKITGKDLFAPYDANGPATWDWDLDSGYTKEEVARVWQHIKASPDFWETLSPLPGAETLGMCIFDLEQKHDIYFITSRASTASAKKQTETWLRNYIGLSTPTVLISSSKGLCAAGLKLDAYIDDNLNNVMDVYAHTELQEPKTRVFLLDKNYNQGALPPDGRITRVRSVGQMLDYLTLGL